MREQFRRHQQGQWCGREHHLLQRAVVVIGLEQTLQSQHAREHGTDPQHTGRDLSQGVGLGPNAQRKQGRDDDKEKHRREKR